MFLTCALAMSSEVSPSLLISGRFTHHVSLMNTFLCLSRSYATNPRVVRPGGVKGWDFGAGATYEHSEAPAGTVIFTRVTLSLRSRHFLVSQISSSVRTVTVRSTPRSFCD